MKTKKTLPEYNEILYHAKTLTDDQFREYWDEVQGNAMLVPAESQSEQSDCVHNWKEAAAIAIIAIVLIVWAVIVYS